MEIKKEKTGKTREGDLRYNFIVENNKGTKYPVSIVVRDKIPIDYWCTCLHYVWETSRKIKTGIKCRHLKKAIELLKSEEKI